MQAQVSWTSEAERRLIYEEAVGLLERMGMRFGTGRAFEVLAEAGADADQKTGVVRIPAGLVERALATCPHDIVLGGARPEHDCVLDGSIHFLNSGSPTHTLDFETGDYRGSTYEDLRRATMLLTRMPSVDILWGIVSPTDVATEERIFRELAVQLTFSDLHVQHEIEYAWQAETMLRMLEVAGCDTGTLRERPRFSVVCCTASPLLVHSVMLDACLELAVYGIPILVYPMPVAGGNAPVTVAGAVTMDVAEFLGVTTAIQLASPGAPVLMGAGTSVLDMKATTFSFAALEAAQMVACCIEVSHELGIPILAPGLATDAKNPGIQAGYEKALKGLAVASAGADLITGGIGLLEGANLLYLPQIVIDDEIAQMTRRLLGQVDISRESIMTDVIERVGFDGNYLTQKETRRRVRGGEQFYPTISSRLSYEAWKEAGRDELDVAAERTRALLAEAEEEGPVLAADQVAELEALVASGARLAKTQAQAG
jgi:trimethylamine--corrinoid protein Co-methyltransferase